MSRVGVLGLQGDVPEQRASLAALLPDRAIRIVRTPEELAEVDGILMPGGESTTLSRLLSSSGLEGAIRKRSSAKPGLPILATCAGLILIARSIEASPGGRDPTPLGLLDVRVRRNDYGRQRESFEGPVRVEGWKDGTFPGVFIRAPRILAHGPSARPFAFRGTEIVGVRDRSIWGLAFHPELTQDHRMTEAFLRSARLL